MFKQNLKRIISFFYPAVYKNGVVILNYHSVFPNRNYSLSPEKFEEQMRFLKENHYVISLSDLDKIDEGNGLKIVITFDDGYEDNYLYAFPILKKLNLPATIFLTSDFVLNGLDIAQNWIDYTGLNPLNNNQIFEMKENNISFGSHSKTHPRFSEIGESERIKELKKSKTDLENVFGFQVESFAFPFGQKKCTGRIDEKSFKDLGYKIVCTTNWGINKNPFDLYSIKRIRIDHFDTLSDFKNKISGKWNFISFFQKNLNYGR